MGSRKGNSLTDMDWQRTNLCKLPDYQAFCTMVIRPDLSGAKKAATAVAA